MSCSKRHLFLAGEAMVAGQHRMKRHGHQRLEGEIFGQVEVAGQRHLELAGGEAVDHALDVMLMERDRDGGMGGGEGADDRAA